MNDHPIELYGVFEQPLTMVLVELQNGAYRLFCEDLGLATRKDLIKLRDFARELQGLAIDELINRHETRP